MVGTTWNTDDIWLRREFTMPAGQRTPISSSSSITTRTWRSTSTAFWRPSEGGFLTAYEPLEIAAAAKALLKPGAKITLAVHCHQTTGGQGVDVGVVDVTDAQP